MKNRPGRLRKLENAGGVIIVGAKCFKGGTVVIERRSSEIFDNQKHKREEVVEFSRRSRERLAFVSRETIVEFHSLMTLSYGKQYPLDGKEVKQHLNRFLAWYRRVIGGEYIWWLEFQERGAPHIHIASQADKIEAWQRKEFAHNWRQAQGLVTSCPYTDLRTREVRTISSDVYLVHSHPKQWSVSRVKDGPKRYILKYALKMRQKIVPPNYRNVGRFWGASRGVLASIPDPEYIDTSEADIRDSLEAIGHKTAGWECIPKMIFNAPGLVKKLVSNANN